MIFKKFGKKILFCLSLLLVGITSLSTLAVSVKALEPERQEVLSQEEYEDSLLDWSVSDHLYIHYLREVDTVEDYSDWIVWSWQKVPVDNAGTVFNWSRYDQSGAIVDIDLTSSKFVGTQKLGFLIVLDESRNATTGMWTSDSGGDVYIDNLQDKKREDGSIHIFATQGNSLNYTYQYTGEIAEDPFANDKGGDYVSKGGINSSLTDAFPVSKTSSSFVENAGVGYQIQVASYSDSDGDGYGDINGITEKLDYIEALNVDVIWLTPVQECESYHGYDVIDFYNIDSRFGNREDYRKLIYQAHQRGIKVVMDLVVNHTSLNNVWFKRSVSLQSGVNINDEEINYRDFYQWKYSDNGTTFSDGKAITDAWHKYGTTNYYYYGKFATSMPELNYDYQGTRDAMVDVAKYWLGFGVDGFRIDAVKHIYMKDEVASNSSDVVEDVSPDGDYSSDRGKNINFFKEFSARIKSIYPNAYIVGENFDGWDQRIAKYYQGMDSMFDFAAYYHFVYNNFHGVENNAQQEALNVVPNKYSMFNTQRGDKAINAPFTSNHDVERMLNHVNNAVLNTGSGASETHVAITASNAANAIKKAQVYAASQILMPGLSFIYYGDELGMSGNITPNDPSNAPEDSVGKDWNEDRWYRQPMKWGDTLKENSVPSYDFSGYTVTWDSYNANTLVNAAAQAEDQNSMLSFFRKVTALKDEHPALIHGTFAGLSTGNQNVFAYSISYNGEVYYIYHNYSSSYANITMSGNSVLLSNQGATKGVLPAYGTIVLK